MTRLLVPEMFGLVAVAYIILFGIGMISDLGLGQNIIQSKNGNKPAFLNTVWTINIVRGLFIWLITVLIAVSLYFTSGLGLWQSDTVYADPLLPWVIIVLSLTVVIDSLQSTKSATASRNLQLKRITLMDISTQLFGILVMVSWAMFDRSVWALVAGGIAGSTAYSILSHVMLPGPNNRLHWDKTHFLEIFHFGKWIFVASMLGFLTMNGDRIILGGLTDTATLGIYSIAVLIWTAMRDGFGKLMDSIAYPALSEVSRDRPWDLRKTYYKFRLPLDIATLLGAGGMFAAGHLITDILYDDRYADAGMMLQILSIGLVAVRYDLSIQTFMAVGKPRLLTPINILSILILFIATPLAYQQFGIDGAVWAVVCSYLGGIPMILYHMRSLQFLDWRHELLVLPLLPAGYLIGAGINFLWNLL